MDRLKRHIGQKIAMAMAVVCTAMAMAMVGVFAWLLDTRGMADTWTPSALTTVFFLLFCAIVLYVMSRPAPVLPLADAALDH